MERVILEANPGYIIFFDNQHVEKYVTSFSTNSNLGGGPSEASIEMVYAESFMKIPYMTDVRIFSKNIFSSKYKMIFEGQLRARQVSMGPQGKSILFTALDNMTWLQRTPVPFLFGSDLTADQIVCFSWLAKGINFERVQTILTNGSMAFDNMNLETVLKTMFEKVKDAISYHAGETDEDKDSIYHWIDLGSKIKIISDIDAALRQDSKLDIFYQGSIVENMYVLLQGLVNQLGYEMFQDTDGFIKIKEPYWADSILKPFVIDPILMTGFNEATNWDNYYSRVLVTGGVDSSIANSATSEQELHSYMPAGVYVGGGQTDDIYVDLKQAFNPELLSLDGQSYVKDNPTTTTTAARSTVVSIAMAQKGKPYVRGTEGPNAFDCSGLVYYALRRAGFASFSKRTTFDMYPVCRQVTLATIQPGDLGFSNWESRGPGHVGMYCGEIVDTDGVTKYTWVQAGNPRSGVYITRSANKNADGWQKFGDIISNVEGGFSGTAYVAVPTGDAYKPLTKLTDLERRYGINVYETNQQLIKTSNNGTNYGNVVPLLKRYSKYLYENLNSVVSSATLSLVSAPWLRLGFNIWFDPNGISRVYYINSIRHSGDASGVYTSLGLTFGRTTDEWSKIYNDRTASGAGTNVLTYKNNIIHAEYAVPESSDPMIIVRPNSLDKHKTHFKNLFDFYKNKGSVVAHNSAYRDIYGQHFVRRNVEYLNRWDSEFNVLELYYMMKAMYSPVGTTISYDGEPNRGVVNPMNYKDRAVSDFARAVVDYDSKYLEVPDVVRIRTYNLMNIMVAAEKELNLRYIRTTPNDVNNFNK